MEIRGLCCGGTGYAGRLSGKRDLAAALTKLPVPWQEPPARSANSPIVRGLIAKHTGAGTDAVPQVEERVPDLLHGLSFRHITAGCSLFIRSLCLQ